MSKLEDANENRKHTPGPWSIPAYQTTYYPDLPINGPGTPHLAVVRLSPASMTEQAANARLIAAAPALLDALIAVRCLVQVHDAAAVGVVDRAINAAINGEE